MVWNGMLWEKGERGKPESI